MCRLFGLHAGRRPAAATFWLLNAPDNLAAQSRRNPDGTGVGVFGADGPVLQKQPVAAWHDTRFAAEAKDLTGTTFIAHVRYATAGGKSVANTHPFLQDGRLLAHNGGIEGLDLVESRLRELGTMDLVAGQTDSERVFALITGCVRARDGDVDAGLCDAIDWLAGNVPILALNILLCTATDFWALRYPETHQLYILERRNFDAHRRFELRTDRISARSDQLMTYPSVVFASEAMDDDPAWRPLAPGELVHVGPDLTVQQQIAFPDPPRTQLTLPSSSPP